jgi:hypothetical protein
VAATRVVISLFCFLFLNLWDVLEVCFCFGEFKEVVNGVLCGCEFWSFLWWFSMVLVMMLWWWCCYCLVVWMEVEVGFEYGGLNMVVMWMNRFW